MLLLAISARPVEAKWSSQDLAFSSNYILQAHTTDSLACMTAAPYTLHFSYEVAKGNERPFRIIGCIYLQIAVRNPRTI